MCALCARAQVMAGPEAAPIKVVQREIALSSCLQHDNLVGGG